MEQIGIRELRQHASRYLARVAAGESIEVTDRGRAVARLVPSPPAADDLLDQMEADGLLIRATRSGPFPPPLPAVQGQRMASGVLAEMREHER